MARLPRLTARFSDDIGATELAVAKDGQATITAPGHGITAPAAVCIAACKIPNAVAAAVVLDELSINIVVSHEHDLTAGWQPCVELAGFDDPLMNGEHELLQVPDRTSFVIANPGVEALALNSDEVLLEQQDDQVAGWHPVAVVDGDTLTFPTPARVARSYTSLNPTIVKDIRVWAAPDYEAAAELYMQFTKSDRGAVSKKCYCFITPALVAKLSKDRRANSDAMVEAAPNAYSQQMLLDGFNVYAFIPADQDTAAIEAMDLCQGELFAAMLRTFNGMEIQRPELLGSDHYVAWLISHGKQHYSAALYVHEYSFEAPALITNEAGIRPDEITEIDIDNPNQSNAPVGSTNFGEVVISDAGLRIKGHPGNLTASIKVSE